MHVTDWVESQESANSLIRPFGGQKELRRTALSLLHHSSGTVTIVSKITLTFCGEQNTEKHFQLLDNLPPKLAILILVSFSYQGIEEKIA